MQSKDEYVVTDADIDPRIVATNVQTDIDIAEWTRVANDEWIDTYQNNPLKPAPTISHKERKKRTAKKKAAKHARKRNRR